MTHIEFLPFHNRHIEFVADGVKNHGVVVGAFNGENHQMYNFIPTGSMIAWKNAERTADTLKMRSLEKKIDIETITAAAHLPW